MFVVLLVQKPGTSRRDNDATSSWRGADEVRPLPAEVLANPWISTLRWTLLAALVMSVVLLPVVLSVDYVLKASALICFAIIGMSLVVLTGWAGQISLGQMAIVGMGAAVSATCTLALERRPVAGVGHRRRCGRPRRLRGRGAGAPAARAVPGGHHVRVRARGAVLAAQRPVLRLVPQQRPSASNVRRCSVASPSTRPRATTRTR